MKDHKCCICGRVIEHKKTPDGTVYWTAGENAEPVKQGRCCKRCYEKAVLPARLGLPTPITPDTA